jgi:N-acetyl-gamma-glutamyl-phosphate reductase
VYGLPELFADRVAGAQLIANPGCFPTPVILGCAPLVAAGLIEPGPILVDGKTGLSGAGKASNEHTIYATSQDSVRPYRLPRHQHTPEMERGIELATGLSPSVLFASHLVPTVRGVLVTCYVPAAAGVDTEQVTDALVAAYAGRPFVRVLPPGQMSDSKRVRGTNVVELQALVDPRTGTAVIVGALDNLVKGAAGQAIQNYNLSAGLDEATDLPTLAVYP